jgi:copper(I)-binding protein/NADH:ubiquinone oxidoreductase subunit E
MSSPSSDVAAEAVILLGRGMPRGEQEVWLDAMARDLMASNVAPRVRVRVVCAFLEMTAPSLEDTITRLAAEGATRIVVAPAFVPWDRNIQRWLPRYLAFRVREQGISAEVVMAQPIESTQGFADALNQSIARSRDLADVRDSYKPLRRRQGRSQVPAYKRQVYVCLGPRCTAAGAWRSYDKLRESLRAGGLDNPGEERVMVVRTACQHPCNLAPLMSVQPDDVWYGELDETRVQAIVQSHFVQGKVCEKFAYRAGERVRTPDLAVDMKDDYPTVSATQGSIKIHEALARPAMKVVDAGALFMRLENQSGVADTLIAVQTPLSDKPRIHDPAVSHVRLEDLDFEPLALPAGATVELKAGHLHMMLLSLKADLIEGDPLPVRLVFEHAGAIDLKLTCHPPIDM